MNARAEKVSRMFGKTTYKDFRQGFARVNPLDADSDSDIKMAISAAHKNVGPVAVMCLETHYASTLDHQRELRRAWDEHCGKPDNPQFYPVRRLGCSLAIIEHAGRQASQREVKEWAWMLHTRAETIEEAMRAAVIWMEGLTQSAATAFVRALREDD